MTRPVIWGNQGNGQPRQWSLISIAHGAQCVLGISLFERPPITYNYHAGADSRNNPYRRVLWFCFNGRENIFNLLANLREVMIRAARRPALLLSQEDCAIFGEDITSRQEVYVTGFVIMFHEWNSDGSVVMPGQDTSPLILNRRVNVIGLVVNLRANRYRAERAAVLLHFQEGRVLPDMSSVISFTRGADTYGVLGMLREIANMATISPTLVHSPENCAPPMQDISSVISFNQGVDVFGTLVVLREITNMASIWPTLQHSEQIYAGLGRNIASIVLFERRVYLTDRVGLFRELANGAFRASDLFHCQKRCALLGKDILGSSRKNRVTRYCYSKSLSSNSGHSLNIDQPETFCRGDLDRKTSESKITLIDKGPINPLDIQSGVNGQNKNKTQELALVKDALAGNHGGMERIVAQRGAGVLPDFDNAALVCGCLEHERIAIKNMHKNGQSNNGDENCHLDNRTKNLSDGCLVSDSEDEDYSWLGDKESQHNSMKDIESDHDWTYGSDSENDSEYQSDDESDQDQAEEDYFMELLRGDGQNHPVNPPQYDLMPHWLPGYILDAHAVMNAQAHQPNPGPPEEAPAGAHPHHLPDDAQDQPQAVNDVDVQNELNGEGHEEGLPNGPQMPAMAQPVLPQGGHHPQQGNQPQQQAQATGPLNRLRAAARYVKRKLTRQNNPVPMYVPGAPREERTPIGLEEAPALVGVPMIPHDDGDEMGEEAQPRGLFACFTSLFRRHGNPVEEYALQAEQVQEFEEQIPIVEPEIDVLEEDMQVVEEPVEGAEPQAIAVEAF